MKEVAVKNAQCEWTALKKSPELIQARMRDMETSLRNVVKNCPKFWGVVVNMLKDEERTATDEVEKKVF